MKLVLIGTGTPKPTPDRSGPCAAVVVGDHAYLIDCGPGVVRRCVEGAATLHLPALAARKLDTVFISHLHSDHTIGYPDLILTPWVMGRVTPLRAFGPRGLASMTRSLLRAYREDIAIRVHGLESESPKGSEVSVREVGSGVILREGNVTVSAFHVLHGSWKEALGFRFDVAGKSIVFSGDTAPCPELVREATDTDLLVHEAYAQEELASENRAGGSRWPEYMRKFHTSAVELGRLATQAHPKLLVITHLVRKSATDEQIIREIREGGYAGPVVIAKDLDEFEPGSTNLLPSQKQ